MPPPDIDIPTAAIALIREHGDRASLFAAMEADAILEAGGIDGDAHWRLVLVAIRSMVEPVGMRH